MLLADQHTNYASVFRSLFGSDGMLVRKAVLLVTHNGPLELQRSAHITLIRICSVKHMHAAHNIIVLQTGRIQYQGTIEEIKKQGFETLIESSAVQHTANPVPQEPSSDVSEGDAQEEEVGEAALAKESLGLTPYSFYSRKVGRLSLAFAMVRVAFLDVRH